MDPWSALVFLGAIAGGVVLVLALVVYRFVRLEGVDRLPIPNTDARVPKSWEDANDSPDYEILPTKRLDGLRKDLEKAQDAKERAERRLHDAPEGVPTKITKKRVSSNVVRHYVRYTSGESEVFDVHTGEVYLIGEEAPREIVTAKKRDDYPERLPGDPDPMDAVFTDPSELDLAEEASEW